ncbi:MAG TPA: hypothetical protein VIS99_14385 [Terrimicrobiaceae bacterium]
MPRVNALLPGNRALIVHWPAKAGSKQLKLAVKDNIDMEGVVTTAGSEYFAKIAPRQRRTLRAWRSPDNATSTSWAKRT